MITIKIKRPIYIRKGPGRSFDALAPIYPSGKDIEMDGIEKGEDHKGIDDWYYKFNEKGEKQSYWAGGAQAKNFLDKKWEFLADPFNKIFYEDDGMDENKWKVSWAHVDLEIWKIWKQFNTKGEGVNVAIIDTGVIAQGNDLFGKIDATNSHNLLVLNPSGLRDTDKSLHGTKSAGVIAADGATVQSVYGVAPGCKLVVYRLFESAEGTPGYLDQNFCKALSRARSSGAHIISMSFERIAISDKAKQEIQLCIDSNILVVASAGNVAQGTTTVNKFPASATGCLSIGAYLLDANKIRNVYTQFSSKSDALFCLAPGRDIRTTSANNLPAFHHATSAAAPFMAGILALTLSYRIHHSLPIDARDITEKIKQSCDKINSQPNWDTSEGYGVINPIKLINLLQK